MPFKKESPLDIGILGWGHTDMVRKTDLSETQLLMDAITKALTPIGLTRTDVDFTCAGSCDYVAGQPFSFVQNIDAVGAWPPKRDSHVEMDGAWALYEAWLRLKHGDIDVAVVMGSGRSSTADPAYIYPMEMDPYMLAPLGADAVSFAALQARALLDAKKITEREMAEVAARCRAAGKGNAFAQVTGDFDVDKLLEADYVRAPLRRHDLPPITDGAIAMVLATRRKIDELGKPAVWITGIDHRSEAHYPGVRKLTESPSVKLAAKKAGLKNGDVQVAELQTAFTHEELLLRQVLGLGDDVEVNPSGGPLVSNPIMATGLIRIAEAARQIRDNGKTRTLAHSTSGPCLQQNLVCILEGIS